VVTFILNLIVIASLGAEGVAAFGVVSYSLYIGVLFFFGLSEALQAVCSQCFGAKNVLRMHQFLKITIIFTVISALLFSALLLAFGDIFRHPIHKHNAQHNYGGNSRRQSGPPANHSPE